MNIDGAGTAHSLSKAEVTMNQHPVASGKTLHRSLCEIAVRWLKRARSAGGPGCAVAVSECKTGHDGEIPDAIGFRHTGYAPTDGSVLIEVKVSRADFLADARKHHRKAGGVGSWRYYMAPEGLIDPAELPDGWGLLQVNPRGHVKPLAGHALYFKGRDDEYVSQATQWRFPEVNLTRENFLLVRALANTGDPQKVLGMLRESNNRTARLSAAIERIAKALGLPQHASSFDVERTASRLLQQLERYRDHEKSSLLASS
ncbi:adenylosuccinate synthase [Bordetella flabilis]|uniref:adenylosuccinate synthase n=1 Tax=Bordetella flabilis TaxID=463014 RepID=UPI000A8DF931|nr:adenylosuccinate synthase [Bordetella flabilis]